MLSAADFVARFEDLTLDPADFRHADHVRLAWLYLQEHSFVDASRRFVDGLVRFATHHGVPGKYDAELTADYLRRIHARCIAGQTWPEFVAANPDLLRWPRGG